MNTLRHLFLIIAVAAAAVIPAAAQVTSPYSMYGYGLLRDNATSEQRQMGGTGYAMRSGRQINAMNPASYAAADSMTFLFDIGTDVSLYFREDATGKDRDWGGGLDYITMQFPVAKNVGVSLGLVPYSSVGYAFGSDIKNGTTTHQGLGGINQLYLGAGYAPFKNFSVGFNVSYLFGTLCNDVYANSSDGTSAVFEQMMEVKDFHFRFGAQYTLPLSRRNSVTLGISYEPGKTLLGNTYVLKYRQNSTEAPDTIAPGVISLKNRFGLVSSYGVGLAWDWNKQAHVEVDFTYQPWSKVKYATLENFTRTKLADRWRIGIGASYQPNPRGGYLKRVTYRAGAFYNRDYIMVGDNHVRDYGLSCGFGIPTISSKTVINLGFEYHNRRATPDPLVKERYFNLTLGVNFNQLWFYRNKLR